MLSSPRVDGKGGDGFACSISGELKYYGGGGGGAGGVIYMTAMPVMAGEYPVVVGQGGAGGKTTGAAWSHIAGSSGGDSSIFGIVAKGGGYGGPHFRI